MITSEQKKYAEQKRQRPPLAKKNERKIEIKEKKVVAKKPRVLLILTVDRENILKLAQAKIEWSRTHCNRDRAVEGGQQALMQAITGAVVSSEGRVFEAGFLVTLPQESNGPLSLFLPVPPFIIDKNDRPRIFNGLVGGWRGEANAIAYWIIIIIITIIEGAFGKNRKKEGDVEHPPNVECHRISHPRVKFGCRPERNGWGILGIMSLP